MATRYPQTILVSCEIPWNEKYELMEDSFRDQDLTTARLRPEDGCYWYEHSGPVENTLVPLRSAGGNPICTSRQS